jgi:hypothetical protein
VINALRRFGVLQRDMLEREAAAHGWREGSFEDALREAIRTGEIAPLPYDFYALRKGS